MIEPKEQKATSALIMLHGLGADADDFEHFREELSSCGAPLEGTRLILPRAPVIPISVHNGYQMQGWFDLFSLDSVDKEDEEGMNKTWKIIRRLIAEQESLGIPRDKIFLGGFSQGGCMALFSALKLDKPIGAIFALSCYLPLASSFDAEHVGEGIKTPIFFGYGKEDTVVAPAYSEISIKELRKLGATKLWAKGYDGMDHHMNLEETADLADFLELCLKGEQL